MAVVVNVPPDIVIHLYHGQHVWSARIERDEWEEISHRDVEEISNHITNSKKASWCHAFKPTTGSLKWSVVWDHPFFTEDMTDWLDDNCTGGLSYDYGIVNHRWTFTFRNEDDASEFKKALVLFKLSL